MFDKTRTVAKIQELENSLLKISTKVSTNLPNLNRNESEKEGTLFDTLYKR